MNNASGSYEPLPSDPAEFANYLDGRFVGKGITERESEHAKSMGWIVMYIDEVNELARAGVDLDRGFTSAMHCFSLNDMNGRPYSSGCVGKVIGSYPTKIDEAAINWARECLFRYRQPEKKVVEMLANKPEVLDRLMESLREEVVD